MFYNDFIGAVVSWSANILGWCLLLLIVAVGFWRCALYAVRQGRELLAAARRDWREATGA